jgi:hypothetical protein
LKEKQYSKENNALTRNSRLEELLFKQKGKRYVSLERGFSKVGQANSTNMADNARIQHLERTWTWVSSLI